MSEICFKSFNLKKSYSGRTVVNGMGLSLSEGEIVGLLGPNGAGKTTCFYMMVGLVKADEGAIFFGEKDITKDPIHKRAMLGIGYLPQEASIFRELSVESNIYSVLEVRGLTRFKRKDILERLMTEFGLQHIRKEKGRTLSGGERRRVEIARVLALQPKFILLDEPFAGVDPLAVNEIQNIIRELKKKNIGILITDHNVRETLGIVDRAYILNNGEILLSGEPDEIIESEIARKFYLGSEFKM
jgi:lipopolysaccharide export system ATP-binding protein